MAKHHKLVRAAVVTALLLAAASRVGLGSQVPRYQTSAAAITTQGAGFLRPSRLRLRSAGATKARNILGDYQVSECTAAIASEKYIFVGQICLALSQPPLWRA